MLKVSRLLVIGIFAVIVALGCGQQTADTSTTTTTTMPPSAGVTISGNLYAGVVRASAAGARAMADADSPIADYTVVAVGTKDGKIYFPDAKTKTADGAFSISVPSGESFYLEVIDDKKKFVAPVSFGVSADKVVMAVTPEVGGGPIDLGKIVYESAKGAAVPTLEVASSKLDTGSTAKPKSGETFVPVGTGMNLGRGTGEAKFTGTLKDKIDEDNDGLPDAVDIDDNGDGKVDGLDPTPRLSGRAEVKITGVNNTNVFSNLPEQYEFYPTYISGSVNNSPINVSADTILAIEVVMSPGTSPDTFTDVRMVDGPAWLATAKVLSSGGGATPFWKDSNYQLTKSSDRWEIHVTPYGTPEAGDVLKFRVTTSSGSEEFIATLTYVFKDIPRLVAYSYVDGAAVVTKEGADLNLSVYQAGTGETGNVFGYKGNNITFTFTAPKDDTESYISGMNYFLDGIVYYGTSLPGTSKSITPIVVTGYPDFGTVNVYTFTPTTDAFTSFKVDIKAQSPTSGGGNASQMVNFKKI